MFCVLFEVHPRPGAWDAYLGYAALLRPELERIDGFVDNVRYRSLTRDGWILSLSTWRDEKSLVRWRTHARHHEVQEKGRTAVFLDYHLRVGPVTRDTRIGDGAVLRPQRLDETEVGQGTAVVLLDAPVRSSAPATRDPSAPATVDAAATASALGLPARAAQLVASDVYDAVLSPGNAILMTTWRDEPSARAFEASVALPPGGRLRRVRVVRDYGLFDRREAPQYFPDVPKPGGG